MLVSIMIDDIVELTSELFCFIFEILIKLGISDLVFYSIL